MKLGIYFSLIGQIMNFEGFSKINILKKVKTLKKVKIFKKVKQNKYLI